MNEKLGISGLIAKKFLTSEIMPLLALVGLLLGIFAVAVTPREEEPQINVTFANVFIPVPGASATEVENLVSTPAEQVLSEIEGVEHIYSVSRPGMAVLTVRYEVGQDNTQAIVRLYNKIFSNQDWLPTSVNIGPIIVKPKGIDDVPIVALTLWTQDPNKAGYELQQVAHAIEAELKRVPGTRDIYTIGGPDRVVHVLLDPQRMAGYGIALDNLKAALQTSNTSADAGKVVRGNQEIVVQAGEFLTSADEVGDLVMFVDAPGNLGSGDAIRDSFIRHRIVSNSCGNRYSTVRELVEADTLQRVIEKQPNWIEGKRRIAGFIRSPSVTKEMDARLKPFVNQILTFQDYQDRGVDVAQVTSEAWASVLEKLRYTKESTDTNMQEGDGDAVAEPIATETTVDPGQLITVRRLVDESMFQRFPEERNTMAVICATLLYTKTSNERQWIAQQLAKSQFPVLGDQEQPLIDMEAIMRRVRQTE